jgi:hypothetical protein
MTILPPPLLLQCPGGSCHKTLMLMLASTAIAGVVNPLQSAAVASIPALILTVPTTIVVVIVVVVSVSLSLLS